MTTIEAVNPATGEVLGTIPDGDAGDVDRAVSAAKAALPGWSRAEPGERGRALTALAAVIEEHGDELARLDVADNGSPVREMRADSRVAAAQLRYFAGLVYEARGATTPTLPGRLNYSLQQPYGVVGRILPFNHPLMFAGGKIAAPLAAGNTVVVKPSEHTSLSTLRLAELARGVLPDGVLNVVTGYGRTAGDALVRHPDVRRLAFIGSAATGRAIQASAASVNVKTVTLELGGKNPLVVFPDADLDAAVQAARRGMNFTWQGQSCGSTSRLLVHRDIYPAFLERLAGSLDTMRQGNPADEDTETGSMVSREQYSKVLRFLDLAKRDGLKQIAGDKNGRYPADADHGFYIRPTLFADVDPAADLAQQEIFGPVLAAMPFGSYEEAVRIANGVSLGLTAAVYTRDLETAHRFAGDVEAGYVWVNEVSRHVPGTGFGGFKDSGIGREESIEELMSYVQSKNVHVNFAG